MSAGSLLNFYPHNEGSKCGLHSIDYSVDVVNVKPQEQLQARMSSLCSDGDTVIGWVVTVWPLGDASQPIR